MSEENKIPNEDELWDVLSAPVSSDSKKPAAPAAAPASAPVEDAAPVEEAAPAGDAPKAADKPEKSGRKIDGFFMACMAGVAAVSVAVTLLVSSMAGGGASNPVNGGNAGGTGNSVSAGSTESTGAAEDRTELENLQAENAQLRAQIELQQKTIVDLQNSLMDFMGTEEFLSSAETTGEGADDAADDVLAKQKEAYEILVQIQNAYAEFDREKLEELIPEMDARLEYLSADAVNSYYLILEYMEQPSNG